MSLHPSYRSGGTIKLKRNVLKRYERIDLLLKNKKWKKGDSVLGLPKTKSVE
ncbi:small basic protein [bacterium]|nr:small basic protein [bacterium]MCP5462145.1 small basic protein [bacterium]